MKKIIIILPMFILALVAIYGKRPNTAALPVNRDVNLAIYSNNNYTSDAYNNSLATVEVTVIKVSSSKQTVLCTKKFTDMQLKDIPAAGNAINSKFTLPCMPNSKDKIYVSYTIEYNSNGSIVTFFNELQETTPRNNNLQIVI